MPGPEAGLRARILRALRHTPGTRVWGWPASAFTGPGHPDLFGLLDGLFFGLEVKTSTGRLTMRQFLELQNIRRAGGYAWVVRTVQQAEQAMAYIRGGKHPPMANDPMDIDAFFKSLDAPEAPTRPEPLYPEPDNAGEEEPSKPNREAVLADLDARSDALNGEPTPLRDYPRIEDQERAEIAADRATELFTQVIQRFDGDVRTQGDRITTVFEEVHNLRLELNVTRNVVQALERAVRQLVTLISDDDVEMPEVAMLPPEPEPTPQPRRTSRRRAS